MATTLTIGSIILAAGASRRFGGQAKQLLPVEGKTLIRRIAETTLAAQLSGPTVVVLGANQEAITPELAGLPIHIVINPLWEQGMSTSLQAGLTAACQYQPDLAAVVVLLCDQPLITPALIQQLIATHTQTGKPMVACHYNGEAGVPALFSRAVFKDLLTLKGDKGARYLLRKRKTDLVEVGFEPAALDLDSWADVDNWMKP